MMPVMNGPVEQPQFIIFAPDNNQFGSKKYKEAFIHPGKKPFLP